MINDGAGGLAVLSKGHTKLEESLPKCPVGAKMPIIYEACKYLARLLLSKPFLASSLLCVFPSVCIDCLCQINLLFLFSVEFPKWLCSWLPVLLCSHF